MADEHSDCRPAPSIETLVNEVVNHPSFYEAIENVTPGDNQRSTNTSGNSSVATPREELQRLFHRGSSSRQRLIPQFQQRTTWGPSQPACRCGKTVQGNRKQPYNCKGKKNIPKKTTFTREVVLLRNPGDHIVRGGAKGQLQRLGNVLSCFELDKEWAPDEVIGNLEEAFQSTLAHMIKLM